MYQLGRLVQFDERSRQYPVVAVRGMADRELRSYTWRCDKHFNQGEEGACAGFAWGHELAARPAEISWFHDSDCQLLYYRAQKLDPWEGGEYPGASTFYPGTSILAAAQAAMITGFIGGYRWAFGDRDLKLGIGYHGPAVMGTNWYESMDYPDENGLVTVEGEVRGGHGYLARSYNVGADIYICRNSWGPLWGRGGDFLIKGPDMRRLLYEEGEACFAVHRTTRRQR